MRIEEILWHYKFGIESGIPECCVIFWIENYTPLFALNKEIILYYHNQIEKTKVDYDYIPCPKCLETRNKKELIKCESKTPFPREVSIYLRDEWIGRNPEWLKQYQQQV